MSKEKYYVMHLDDYAAAQFTSFGKMYFGTLEEIGHFIRLLEKDKQTAEAHKDTIEGFYKFLEGDTKITHKVAYQDVKLLTPVRVRGSNVFRMNRRIWTHLNTWRWPVKMRATQIVVEVKLFQVGSKIYRAIRPSFKCLSDYSPFTKQWKRRQECFWGFPHMLDLDGDWNQCRFFVVNEEYKEFSQACEDMYDETKINFEPVINEVYGNG